MSLNQKQLEAVEKLKQGENVLLIGQAGTGKSKLLKELSTLLPTKNVYITSTTGISALNIGGITLYSFLGIQLGKGSKENIYKMIKMKASKFLFKKNVVLCIDEVSMLPLELFEKLDYAFKKLLNCEKPFGGIQILLSGDFLQLEPINQELVYKSSLIDVFKTVILDQNYRQEKDIQFQTLLDNLRFGKITESDLKMIETASNQVNNGIQIFCINKDINKVNNKELQALDTQEYHYKATYTGQPVYISQLKKQFETRGIDNLTLKKGLKVMLTRNDSLNNLVNGSVGVITDFQNGIPVVNFSGVVIPILKATWQLDISEKTVATAVQIPLIMAYACSIHKTQGLTFDEATIDLKNAFCNHQVYVALSRVKSLQGLSLKNFNISRVLVNQETVDFYNKRF